MTDNLDEGWVRYHWVAYAQQVAVCWQEWCRSDGETTYESVGMVLYGEVRRDVLDGFPMRRILPPQPHSGRCIVSSTRKMPLLEGGFLLSDAEGFHSPVPQPPAYAKIAQAWAAHQPPPEEPVDASARRSNESRAQFYQRIANAYIHYAEANGKPTLSIAQAARVTKGTAGKWISEARLLGYLPNTSRGRTSR